MQQPTNHIKPIHPVAVARRRSGLRQIDLATRAQVSRELIVQIEGGHVPRREFRERIAHALSVEPKTLWPEAS